MRNRFLLCCLLLTLLLAACSEGEPEPTATSEPTAAPTEVAIAATATTVPPAATDEPPTATPEPTNTPEPTLTPTPEPIVPEVEASEQRVDEDGVVVIDRVFVEEDSWVALFAGDQLLAASTVDAGETERIRLTVDPLAISDELTARLYEGGDDFSAESPLLLNGDPIETTIAIDLQITMPQVMAADQLVTEESVITVSDVVALSDGWLAVYNDDDGELTDMVGIQWLPAGEADEIDIPIVWREAWPTLRVVLHEDGGDEGLFDRGTDPIVRVGGEAISAEIRATFPLDVAIIHQPVLNGEVLIDRVISDGPGWITILFENDAGEPGNVIGFTQLVDGLNENVIVEVGDAIITPILYARLHTDTGVAGDFDFPNEDPIVLYEEQVIVFPFSTDTGNYVATMDQAIDYSNGEAHITVPLVVADINVFVVVREDVEGTLGDVLGHAWVPAGVTRDLEIEIDAEAATPVLYVAMHIDRDELMVLEFPDGRDFELQRRRAPIAAPFTVLE